MSEERHEKIFLRGEFWKEKFVEGFLLSFIF